MRICLINPLFEPSFYNYAYTLPLIGKACWSAPGALPLLAALAPDNAEVSLIDENVEAIDWESLASFDIVGVTGMVVQRDRMFALLARLRGLGPIVVAGGPYLTVAEDHFEDLCDVRFVGEADTTWPAFLEAVTAGEPYERRYAQAERTDMSTVPLPRYDLLKLDRYAIVPVQFSRGCPFQCEFCDIITIFGRRPRVKTSDQLVREVEALHAAGARTLFLVDDNFYGNKRAAKALLERLVRWQSERSFPIRFSTEASVNIADDPEFMEMMVRANFRQVFIGLESPRAESLNETLKFQNTRGDALVDKVGRVRDAGLVITAGFIVGFDNDDERIFAEQFDFITQSGIAQANISMLTPIPTTPLFDRLKAEGRLDPQNPDVPFFPKNITQAALRRGYHALWRRLYEPEAYFGRVFGGYEGSAAFRRRRAALDASTRRGMVARVRNLVGTAIVATRLMKAIVRESAVRALLPAYVRDYARHVAKMRREAIPLDQFVALCALHWHAYRWVRTEQRFEFGNVQRPATDFVAS